MKSRLPENEVPEDFSPQQLFKLKQQLHEAMLLSARLDIYYKIYQICIKTVNTVDDTPELQTMRKSARSFVQYVLDLSGQTSDEEIDHLMADRMTKSKNNPEYLPGKKPENITDLPSPDQAQSRSQYLLRRHSENALGVKRKSLSIVNEKSRISDQAERIVMLEPVERDPYRVIIYQGKFYARQQDPVTDEDRFVPFSTVSYVSKEKLGLASFTINTDGEISVFNHTASHEEKGGVYHSSMNKGRAVFIAGELEIVNGELAHITPFSGHYRPNENNVYQLLKYLQAKQVATNLYITLMDRIPGLISEKSLSSNKLGSSNRFTYQAEKYLRHFDKLHAQSNSRRSSENKGKLFEEPVKLIQELLTNNINDVVNALKALQLKKSGPIGNIRNKTLLAEIQGYLDTLEALKIKLDKLNVSAIINTPATSSNYKPLYAILKNIFEEYNAFYQSINDKIFIVYEALDKQGKPLLHRELPDITFDTIYNAAFDIFAIKKDITYIKKIPGSDKMRDLSDTVSKRLQVLENEITVKATWEMFSMAQCKTAIADWKSRLEDIRTLAYISPPSPLRPMSLARKSSLNQNLFFSDTSPSSLLGTQILEDTKLTLSESEEKNAKKASVTPP